MSRYPDNFNSAAFDRAFSFSDWTWREDDALDDAKAAIAKYTDAEDLEVDFENGVFAERIEANNADEEQVSPEIAEAVKSRIAELNGVAA